MFENLICIFIPITAQLIRSGDGVVEQSGLQLHTIKNRYSRTWRRQSFKIPSDFLRWNPIPRKRTSRTQSKSPNDVWHYLPFASGSCFIERKTSPPKDQTSVALHVPLYSTSCFSFLTLAGFLCWVACIPPSAFPANLPNVATAWTWDFGERTRTRARMGGMTSGLRDGFRGLWVWKMGLWGFWSVVVEIIW